MIDTTKENRKSGLGIHKNRNRLVGYDYFGNPIRIGDTVVHFGSNSTQSFKVLMHRAIVIDFSKKTGRFIIFKEEGLKASAINPDKCILTVPCEKLVEMANKHLESIKRQ